MVIMTIIFVFISGDMMAISHEDKATDETVEIAAANYYLGIMKSDPAFWTNIGNNAGPVDACNNNLPPYVDTFPTPPAQPTWHNFQFCALAPAFEDPNAASPAPLAIQYMWSAAPRDNDNAADLIVWIRRDGSSPVFEYHGLRYRSPGLESPIPYPTETPSPRGSPTPTPSPTVRPSVSPTPTHAPTPTPPPTPTPSPTPVGV